MEQIDLHTWVTMSLQRSVEALQSRLQGGLAFLATVGSFSLTSDGPLILLSAAGSVVAGYALARLYLMLSWRVAPLSADTMCSSRNLWL